MKNIISLILIGTLFLTGCHTGTTLDGQPITTVSVVTTIEPYVYVATKIACSASLSQVKNQEERIAIANQIYDIADAIDAISGGTLPDADKIEAIIKFYTAKSIDLDRYDSIISDISDIYKEQFLKVKDSPKLALQVLNDMARGARDGAAKILGK